MDTDDQPIESERATNNSNNKYRAKAKQSANPYQARFENITKQLSTATTRGEYRQTGTKSPINLFRDSQMTEKGAINTIMRPCEVVLQNQIHILQAQTVLTSGGLRYVLKLGDHWINISWLHSIKKIEKNKILILFYHMNPISDGRKPSLEPQLLEFTDREVAEEYYDALQILHRQHHESNIEKIYHQTM